MRQLSPDGRLGEENGAKMLSGVKIGSSEVGEDGWRNGE
jgi:hypothetical protein